MEEIQQQRDAGDGIVKDKGQIKALGAAEREGVLGVVKQPGALPGPEPRPDARRQGVVLGVELVAAEQRLQVGQPARGRGHVKVRRDRLRNHGLIGRGEGRAVRIARQDGEPVPQKGPVRRRIRQLQRVEAGRLTGLKGPVPAADGADKQLRAAVPVEEKRGGLVPLGLG